MLEIARGRASDCIRSCPTHAASEKDNKRRRGNQLQTARRPIRKRHAVPRGGRGRRGRGDGGGGHMRTALHSSLWFRRWQPRWGDARERGRKFRARMRRPAARVRHVGCVLNIYFLNYGWEYSLRRRQWGGRGDTRKLRHTSPSPRPPPLPRTYSFFCDSPVFVCASVCLSLCTCVCLSVCTYTGHCRHLF